MLLGPGKTELRIVQVGIRKFFTLGYSMATVDLNVALF
jgi:hypothetical protein